MFDKPIELSYNSMDESETCILFHLQDPLVEKTTYTLTPDGGHVNLGMDNTDLENNEKGQSELDGDQSVEPIVNGA